MNEDAEQELLSLIHSYIGLVRRACDQMMRAFGTSDLLGAVHTGAIPREGAVAGMTYQFHGVGCEVGIDGDLVDFDFGPEERCDGFDAWRLSLMAKSSHRWSDLADEAKVKAVLERLEYRGDVVAPRWHPSPHLYYLAR